jgi:hypothetical protein
LGVGKDIDVWVEVNPSGTILNVQGIRVLRDFSELEIELQRVGKSKAIRRD